MKPNKQSPGTDIPESDKRGDILSAALGGAPPEEEPKPVTEPEPQPQPEPKPEPEPTPEGEEPPAAPPPDGAKAEKVKTRYKSYDEAIAGLVHLDKVIGKHGTQLDKKDKEIADLQARLAAMDAKIAAAGQPKPAPDETLDPIERVVADVLEKRLPRYIEPLKATEARREAEDYRNAMQGKWGPAWEKLTPVRQALVTDMKSGAMREPEIWQLAAIGKLVLEQQLAVEEEDLPAGGALDTRAAARGTAQEPKKPSREDALSDSLSRLVSLPMGVARVR